MKEIDYSEIEARTVKHEDVGEGGYYSVYVYSSYLKWGAWLDVKYTPGQDTTADWNQYIFYNSCPQDQRAKAYQEDCEIYMCFSEEACNYVDELEEAKESGNL